MTPACNQIRFRTTRRLCLLAAWIMTPVLALAAEQASPGTAIITIGDRSLHFTFSDGPGARCRTGMLGNRNGIVAVGYQIDAAGAVVENPATLTVNIYPEDWQPRGKQAHEIAIRGGDPEDNWSTAGVALVERNAGVPALADARVTRWRLAGGRTWGSTTLYRRDSLPEAQSGGSLVLEQAAFDVHCP